MARYRFIEDGVCCDVFYSKDHNNGKNALFLYGFPATIGANKLTDLLVELGYTVLQPHYYGTYDSSGDFTPATAISTVQSILKIVKKSLVRNLKNNTMAKLGNEINMCIGYSFGAYVLKKSIPLLVDVENIMLFSPVPTNNMSNDFCWVNENALEHLNYVLRTRPYTYRIENKQAWMTDYVNDPGETSDCVQNALKNALWIYGKRDSAMIEEKLIANFNRASQCYFGPSHDSQLICVLEGDHDINTLLNPYTIKVIKELLN